MWFHMFWWGFACVESVIFRPHSEKENVRIIKEQQRLNICCLCYTVVTNKKKTLNFSFLILKKVCVYVWILSFFWQTPQEFIELFHPTLWPVKLVSWYFWPAGRLSVRQWVQSVRLSPNVIIFNVVPMTSLLCWFVSWTVGCRPTTGGLALEVKKKNSKRN